MKNLGLAETEIYELGAATSSGGGSTPESYNNLTNKPQINGHTLTGNTVTDDILSDLDTNNFADGVISTSIGNSPTDTEIPTAKAVADDIDAHTGMENTVTANGVLANKVITFTTDKDLLHGEKLEFDLSFTGSFASDGTDKMVISDGTNSFFINNIIEQNTSVSATTKSMRQCATFDGTSYRWHFTGKVKISGETRTIFPIPTIVNPLAFARRYPLLMTNSEMLNATVDGLLGEYSIPNGAIVIAADDDGYNVGHIYKFVITDSTYDWVDCYATP